MNHFFQNTPHHRHNHPIGQVLPTDRVKCALSWSNQLKYNPSISQLSQSQNLLITAWGRLCNGGIVGNLWLISGQIRISLTKPGGCNRWFYTKYGRKIVRPQSSQHTTVWIREINCCRMNRFKSHVKRGITKKTLKSSPQVVHAVGYGQGKQPSRVGQDKRLESNDVCIYKSKPVPDSPTPISVQ